MSTLKRIPELLVLGVIISIGIGILLGKITISESWFSLRTLQVSLGSGLFILLFMYIHSDRKDLSPNKLKALMFKSKVAVTLLFGVLLWGVLSQPVVPVNVSFEGVAKTTDVMAVKRDVQRANENVTVHAAFFSSFQKKQEQENKNLLQQVEEGNKKVVELDLDERVRQEATSDQIAAVANDVKKVSVGVEDVKKIDHTTPVTTSTATVAISEKNRVIGFFALIALAVVSFIFSFFYQTFTKVSVKARRYGIPAMLFALAAALFFYPVIVNNIPSMPDKKTATQDVPVKKETSIVVDTATTKKEPQVQVEETQPTDSVQQEKPMAVDTNPVVQKKKKKKNHAQSGDEKPMRVID